MSDLFGFELPRLLIAKKFDKFIANDTDCIISE